jgi:glycerol-3-phosphate cytidylyltransferase-like family protein
MSIRYIDDVYIYQTEEELYELIKFFKPDIRILGEDYIGKTDFTGSDLPPKIIYTTRSHGWSTTKLKDLITIQTIKQNPALARDILKGDSKNG